MLGKTLVKVGSFPLKEYLEGQYAFGSFLVSNKPIKYEEPVIKFENNKAVAYILKWVEVSYKDGIKYLQDEEKS